MPTAHEYKHIATNDNETSSAEGEEQSIGIKGTWLEKRQITLRQRASTAIKSHWWIVNTALLLIVIVLLLQPQWRGKKTRYEFAGDLTGFAPSFSQQITMFQPDLSFVPENLSDFWSDTVQKRWLSIVPRGLGYLHIDNPNKYDNLPHPIHDYANMTVFTTAMPHQLHCLYNILEVYYAIAGDNPRNVPTEMTFHLQHCFEYLRLSIMCCGDVALEESSFQPSGAETTFPEGFGGSDGWDAKHVCKDYGEMFDYMDKNRANDRVWIGI